MKRFSRSFFRQRPQSLSASLFCVVLLALLWASCKKADDNGLELHFPQTFAAHTLRPGFTKVYWLNENYQRIELTRAQSGTFAAFLDTMAAYTELDKMHLNFTGVEFLDASRVRIFSDGSLGILAFDTIVGYSQQGNSDVIRSIQVNWTLLNAPLVFLLASGSGSNGQHVSLTPVWFAYTHQPFMPPFQVQHVPLQQIYAANDALPTVLSDVSQLLDYGKGDTLAIHYESIIFE